MSASAIVAQLAGAAAPAASADAIADLAAAQALAKTAAPALLGTDAAQSAEVEQWLALLNAKPPAAAVVAQVESALGTRTYLAGYSFTLADIAVYVAVQDAAGSAGPNRCRWQALCQERIPAAAAPAAPAAAAAAAAATAAVPAAAAAAAPAAKKGKGGEGAGKPEGGAGKAPAAAKNAGGGGDKGSMPALEGAEEGKVVTRFPPEPSGYLHIGHVKAVLLNNFYARHYKGKLIIRFDDTNPSKEKDEFEQNIIADLAGLGVVGDFVSHTSDYFDLLTDYARNMLRAGKAFMDDTPQEQMRAERQELKDSKHKHASVEDNLKRFELMLGGGEEGGKWCMRANINMQDPNGTLRDPVLFRCNETPHHRTGTKYKAYPTYDFACPIVDSLEGVTHALRTNEYHDRDAQYKWIQNALGIRPVVIHEFSRLNFIYTLLSKRKLTWFADNNYVDGWYDPRFPTVQGMLRRGVVVPALHEFILNQGASKRVLDMEWDKFWATNKKHIDPVAARYTCVSRDGRVPVTLTGPGTPAEAEARSAPLHPKNADVGTKAVFYAPRIWLEQEDAKAMKEGEEVTLMKWGNAIIRKIAMEGDRVTAIDAELHLEGDFKKTEKKVTWVADLPQEEYVQLSLQEFDFLITVPKLEEGDDFMAAINPVTKYESFAVGEPAMRALKAGDIIQLERKGYFRVDRPYLSADRPMVLFGVPDGRANTLGVTPRNIAPPKAAKPAEAAAKPSKASKAAAAAAAAAPAEGNCSGTTTA